MRITAIQLVAGFLVVSLGAAVGQPGQDNQPAKEKAPKGDSEKVDQVVVVRELQQAFEGITDLAQAAPTGKEAAQLFDHAKMFYREAVKAYPADLRRARALAGAANDAVRGLAHSRRSSLQPVPGLPEPPADPDATRPVDDGVTGKPGPWTPVLEALNSLRDPVANSGTLAKGAGKDFFDEADRAYRQGRKAYEAADYRKAGELAKAAGAWLSAMNHLDSIGWDKVASPLPLAPELKKNTPLPPVKE